jgi:hypothetical protein
MTALITVCRSARLTPAAYQFYSEILRTFPEQGEPPHPAMLGQLAVRFAVPLAATLADMAAQDLIQLDDATGRIRAAYPFSSIPTIHGVTLAPDPARVRDDLNARTGQQVFAMCALGALGIPLLLRREATIVSQDALTNEPVEVIVARVSNASPATLAGWSARWNPPSAMLYARSAEHEHEHDAGCAAAGACCPVTNFFTDMDHALQWAQTHAVSDGVVLAPVEALHRAQALFGGVLHRMESEAEEQPTPPSVRSAQSSGLTIELLYFNGCPNYEHAVALVRKALAAERITAPIQLLRIETEADARCHSFYGSPTIRINSVDIAPLPPGATPSLACRVYRMPDGRLAPVPAYETVVAGLRRTAQQGRWTSTAVDCARRL